MTASGTCGLTARMMPDGRRLHLQHGPIDLIVRAYGGPEDVRAAYRQVVERFSTILDELVAELVMLRRPADAGRIFCGTVAQRMQMAVLPHSAGFITPMAAVAGAVADDVLDNLLRCRVLRRAFVNNGGDIALYLAEGARFDAAIVTDPIAGISAGRTTIRAGDGIRGIATSGRHGRSHSFGIADSVTVLADCAAAADAAATMIANAVDLPHSAKITRVPANQLDPDSDLADRPVTTDVAALTDTEIDEALAGGLDHADALVRNGVIKAAFLTLVGRGGVTKGRYDDMATRQIGEEGWLESGYGS